MDCHWKPVCLPLPRWTQWGQLCKNGDRNNNKKKPPARSAWWVMHACRSWCWPLSSPRPSSLTTFLHTAPATWVAAVNHLYKVTLVWTAWPWLVRLHVCPWHAMFISGSEISHLMPHRPLVVWRWLRWLVSTCWEAFIIYMLHKSHLEGLLSSAVQYDQPSICVMCIYG